MRIWLIGLLVGLGVAAVDRRRGALPALRGRPGPDRARQDRAQGRAVRLRARGACARARHGLAAHRRGEPAPEQSSPRSPRHSRSPCGAAPRRPPPRRPRARPLTLRPRRLPRPRSPGGTSEGEGTTVEGGGIQCRPAAAEPRAARQGPEASARARRAIRGSLTSPGRSRTRSTNGSPGWSRMRWTRRWCSSGARCSPRRRSRGRRRSAPTGSSRSGSPTRCSCSVVVAAGALVMSHETLQSSYALKDLLPRLAVAAVAANASLAICGQMVNIANALSTALLGGGVEPEQAGHTLELLVLNAIDRRRDIPRCCSGSRARCSPSRC